MKSGKIWNRVIKKIEWTFLENLGFVSQYLESPYFSRCIAWVISMEGSLISMQIYQWDRDRTTIRLRRRKIKTPLKMTARSMRIHLKSQTWYPTRSITTERNRNSGCPISVMLTAAKPHPLILVALESPYDFPQLSWRPREKWILWKMAVPK